MSLKITASSFVESHYLALESDGVKFVETALTGGKRHFRFSEIDCVILSDDHLLSFQAEGRVYAIPTKPEDAKHQTVIASLVQALKNSATGWSGET